MDVFSLWGGNASMPYKRVLCGFLVLLSTTGLSACGNKENKAGQALVRVNGDEITVLQINDELRRAGVKSDQQEAATKQLLESLIDRQLIIAEAKRNKIDRSPEVIQAIERGKAQIITQAYLKNIVTNISKPSKTEINDYFQKHPEYFTQRKQYDIQQLIIATKDLNDKLKSAIDTASSLDGVETWLNAHNIQYSRGKLSRNTTDLPEAMVAKLMGINKGQLFIVNEGEKSLLNTITDIRNSPVSAKDAEPQIEQYLISKKSREAAEAEITHLRSLAKIEYLNASAPSAH